MKKPSNHALAALGALALASCLALSARPAPVRADAGSWIKGVSIVSRSASDFESASFEQSVRNARSLGADTVALIIPYRQTDEQSSDIGPTPNTPSDATLGKAIDLIHSLGMKAVLKPHLDPENGAWRAFIRAADRNAWYAGYETILERLGDVGESHHAEEIVAGTELIGMASSFVNADNAPRWLGMIADLRRHYRGLVTYSANWGVGSVYANEFENIGFWPALDQIGISAYFNLEADGIGSTASLEDSWSAIDQSQISALEARYGKPVVFTEIGYKSVQGAHDHPWDAEISGNSEDPSGNETSAGGSMVGSYSGEEQANDYRALFGYWTGRPYWKGALLWDWSSDPNYGGPGNLDYTVRGKPAEDVVRSWFGGSAAAGL